ncbi:hypothetical protein TSTA_103910 [Talaromyces stipitatus ATCC 10500]|uniref:Uncharacterized protein n=1 Tax=Talaromyces stipitatus (strain ATCC 10500 / CBS 375.48 / QM 6759 / NRRL 1006) TaxID=441959 RepID=B8MNT3_TALSN|nr:uncharacterized protein TSTA_103910 [Talaromyces stipitatus ATCC 10500]EED14172.1 hypothetical protein TSTA_103910 [Talaromyces stipitatus ATCC 10500]
MRTHRLENKYAVRGYDGKTATPITHAIIFTLIVNGYRQLDVPFLIINLGKHNMILGRIWFAKHNILVDYAKKRLLWPEEVSLKDEIIIKGYTPEEKLEKEEIRKKLPAYLKDFVDVFSKHESDKLPLYRPYDYKIELENPNKLSYNPLYKMSGDKLEAAREYIINNLNKGFLEPSSSSTICSTDYHGIEAGRRIAENMVEYQIHIKMVLERLRATRLQAAIHKCEFSVE